MNLMRVFVFYNSAWIRSDRGSAALEFGFIAPIFFVLMLGIMEIGVMTFSQFALQNSVTDAGRLIRTGQARDVAPLLSSSIPVPQCAKDAASTQVSYATEQAWFAGQICCGVTPLLDCSNLQVTVMTPPGGFGTNFDTLLAPGTQGTYFGGSASTADQACSVVLVRATYVWTVWFPGLARILNSNLPAQFLVNVGSNGRLLSGTSAFRNEPFSAGVAGC
jgi:Flp pilus assembly protein TadG